MKTFTLNEQKIPALLKTVKEWCLLAQMNALSDWTIFHDDTRKILCKGLS